MSKWCPRCEAEKDRLEFHKNQSRRDGLSCWCKKCCRKYQQSDSGRETSRRYRQSLTGETYIKKYQQKYQQSEAGRETHRRSGQKYEQPNPEKKKAHHAVYRAIKTGKLTRPSICESCFKERFIQAHHESYEKEKWLDVDWLCRECHDKLRKKVGV